MRVSNTQIACRGNNPALSELVSAFFSERHHATSPYALRPCRHDRFLRVQVIGARLVYLVCLL